MGKQKAWRKAAEQLNIMARAQGIPGPQGRRFRNSFQQAPAVMSPFLETFMNRNPFINSLTQARKAVQQAIQTAPESTTGKESVQTSTE
jgi:hypothetical protein